MIALLRGRPASRSTDSVVLDVHGVGYLVSAPAPLVARLPAEEESTLHISTIVREDAFLLYGFETVEERDVFEVLRQVNGVGPRIALSILSTLGHDLLVTAINGKDIKSLIRAPGVGKKLAERLILELDNKLAPSFRPTVATVSTSPNDPLPLALARLEYKKSEIDQVLSSSAVAKFGEASLEDRLRAALVLLARQS